MKNVFNYCTLHERKKENELTLCVCRAFHELSTQNMYEFDFFQA